MAERGEGILNMLCGEGIFRECHYKEYQRKGSVDNTCDTLQHGQKYNSTKRKNKRVLRNIGVSDPKSSSERYLD